MGVDIGAKFAFFQADEKALSYLRARTDQPWPRLRQIPTPRIEPPMSWMFPCSTARGLSAQSGQRKKRLRTGRCPRSPGFPGFLHQWQAGGPGEGGCHPQGKESEPQNAPPGSARFPGDFSSGLEIRHPRNPHGSRGRHRASTCGPCGGRHLGLLGPGENAISATNRNFKGRMGSKESFVYLGSAETVAAFSH